MYFNNSGPTKHVYSLSKSVESALKQNGLGFAQLLTAFEPALEGEHTFIAMVIGYVTTFVPISIMSALNRNINHKNL